jgi:hypothetical protein
MRPSWVYDLCNLWLKKRSGRLHTDCTAPTILKNQTAIVKMATEDFPVLLAPFYSRVFDRKYLVEYPSRKIWLSEAEAWLLSDGLKFYTEGFLFEGRAGSGVFFRRNLISRHLSLLEHLPLSFRLWLTPL